MEKDYGLLSEEISPDCLENSFDSSSDSNCSFESPCKKKDFLKIKSLNNETANSSNQYCSSFMRETQTYNELEDSQNISEFETTGRTSDVKESTLELIDGCANVSESFSAINSSQYLGNSFCDLEMLASPSKIKEFKSKCFEVNEAFVKYKTTELLVETIKKLSFSNMLPPQIREKVQTIIETAVIKDNAYIKSSSGEMFNIFGLEDDQIETFTNSSLSFLERSEVKKQAIKAMYTKTEELKEEKQSLKDEFGIHTQKVMCSEDIVCEERSSQTDLCRQVESKITQMAHLLNSCDQLVHQFKELKETAELELIQNTFKLLYCKAKYLNVVTSIMKEKLNQEVFKNESLVKEINIDGDELLTDVANLRSEKNKLEKDLILYQTQEKKSVLYKQIVADYARLKKEFDHRQQTLKLLEEENSSFS